jgi:sulfur-oxidizing protein SoxY
MRRADTQRRAWLRAVAGVGSLSLAPRWVGAQATASGQPLLTLQQLTDPIVGSAALRFEGVRLEVAALADNGHVVPLRVVVASPMTEADHVTRIWLLSPRNPVTRMALFHLGPWSGRAEIATRVRLAGTQSVVALARLSSGEFRAAQAEVVVTESACLDAG